MNAQQALQKELLTVLRGSLKNCQLIVTEKQQQQLKELMWN